jgi:hypothetical protein
MLVLAREIHNLRHFGFRHLVCENTAFAYAVVVDVEHDMRRLVGCLVKVFAKDRDDKFHGRIIVVQQKNPIHTWLFCLRLGARNNGGTGPITVLSRLFRRNSRQLLQAERLGAEEEWTQSSDLHNTCSLLSTRVQTASNGANPMLRYERRSTFARGRPARSFPRNLCSDHGVFMAAGCTCAMLTWENSQCNVRVEVQAKEKARREPGLADGNGHGPQASHDAHRPVCGSATIAKRSNQTGSGG